MTIVQSVPDEFGIIVPRENGVEWEKQAGGMSCYQKRLEGVYLPIGRIEEYQGPPDWKPSGPNFRDRIVNLDLERVARKDYDSFPEKVQERGHFASMGEYFKWMRDDSYDYGSLDLYNELYKFTYGVWDNIEDDPREKWGNEENLWDVIRECFNFEFEIVAEEWNFGEDPYPEDLEGYPRPEAAIRPIRITECNGSFNDWEELEGEIVFLMCPNAD